MFGHVDGSGMDKVEQTIGSPDIQNWNRICSILQMKERNQICNILKIRERNQICYILQIRETRACCI